MYIIPIIKLRASGLTFKTIAAQFGLSRQRVYQLWSGKS